MPTTKRTVGQVLSQKALRILASKGWDEDAVIKFGDGWNARAFEQEKLLMDDIQGAVAEVERLAGVIQEKRSELYSARALRAPIARVPDDVLRLIFEMNAECLHPARTSSYQVVCSRICRRWRRVCLDTSYLWSRFRIKDRHSLEFAFSHVSSTPSATQLRLNVALSCSFYQADAVMERLCEFVAHSSSNLVSLMLDMCAPDVCTFWTCMTHAFRSLATVRIRIKEVCAHSYFAVNTRLNWMGDALPQVPALQQLRITAGSLPRILSPFVTISSLDLDSLQGDWSTWEKFFGCFPNLRELRLHKFTTSERAEIEAASHNPVILAKLERLELLKDYSSIGLQLVVNAVYVPNLNHLTVELYPNPSPTALVDLLRRQASLTHLSISCNSNTAAIIVDSLAKHITQLPPDSMGLTNLRLVCRDAHPFVPMDRSLYTSLINMVDVGLKSSCPLQSLSLCPRPEEHLEQWFTSKLKFQSDDTFAP